MKFFKALVALIFLLAPGLYAGINDPVAVNGVLDLRHLNDSEFLYKLQGSWEFYWKKMLLPKDFSGNTHIKPDYFGDVPSYWTDYPSDSVKTTPMGYATYRLRILLPAEFRNHLVSICLSLFILRNICHRHINGLKRETWKTESESVPYYERELLQV